MTKFILGTKGPMTQIFDEKGTVHPVTVLCVGPNMVTQIRKEGRDGYSAVQIGAGRAKTKNVAKPQKGHLRAALGDKEEFFRYLREFRVTSKEAEGFSVGSPIEISTFIEGDVVTVSSVSKGKGFQGVVKRHGFHGGPRTHGQKHTERAPGSAGATGPARVFPGQKMPGRMGSDRVTLKNVKVIHIDPERGEIYIKGAVPGVPGVLVEVRSQ